MPPIFAISGTPMSWSAASSGADRRTTHCASGRALRAGARPTGPGGRSTGRGRGVEVEVGSEGFAAERLQVLANRASVSYIDGKEA
ncbi:hypothetical protein [Streptomyces phaeofaciens]|nr:hypothetical protein [Streptomyces phaeofaciens]